MPPHVALQLHLREMEQREVVLAEGRRARCPYVGPVEVQCENRRCFVGALVLGDSVLLGAMPLEDINLVLHPATHKLMANPENPNIPLTVAKAARG